MKDFNTGSSHRRRHKALGCCGAAMIEMALVFPLLLISAAGGIELGELFWAKHVIASSAREAARKASAMQDPSASARALLEGEISQKIDIVVKVNASTISVGAPADFVGDGVGDLMIKVEVVAEYRPIFMKLVGIGSVNVGRTVTSRWEWQSEPT